MPGIESPSHSRCSGMSPGRKIFLIAVGLGAAMLGIGCLCSYSSAPDAPPRDFEIIELLLDDASLPSGWQAGDIHRSHVMNDDDWAEESTSRRYTRYDEDGVRITLAGIHIWRYGESPAMRNYEHMSEQTFPPGWSSPPSEITFESQYADEWDLRCKVVDPTAYSCVYFAVYNEFLVDVYIVIARGDTPNDWLISPEEINSIFAAQDQRMADFLDLEPRE